MSGSMPAHPSRRTRTRVAVLAGVLLLVAGCTEADQSESSTENSTVAMAETTSTAPGVPGPTSIPPLSTSSPAPASRPAPVGTPVPTALASGTTGHVTLAGYLVIDDGSARLCALLLELQPPACGGMSVSVRGSVDHPELLTAGSVRWSATEVDLSGTFTGSVLQADGPPWG